jgi:hypothetical protein
VKPFASTAQMIRNITVDGLHFTGDVLLNFGRPPKWNCPIPETDSAPAAAAARPSSEQQTPAPEPQLRSSAEPTVRNRTRTTYSAQATPAPAPKTDAWEIPAIQCYEPEDGIFYAQMGPTGGKRGYPAITGSWHAQRSNIFLNFTVSDKARECYYALIF